MAEYSFPIPGPEGAAFVDEKAAREFLGDISEASLENASKRLPWFVRHRAGKSILYDPQKVGLLAELLKKNVLTDEIFSAPNEAERGRTKRIEEE